MPFTPVSWASMPGSVKTAAVPDMPAGKQWIYFGREILRPSVAAYVQLLHIEFREQYAPVWHRGRRWGLDD